MYCSNCGTKVSGNFRSNCGSKIITENFTIPDAPALPDSLPTLEKKYEELIKTPEVRNLISKYARESPNNISAEEFLKFADLAFSAFMGGVSIRKIAEVMVPIYQKLGIKTGKSFTQIFPLKVSDAIVKVLCSLAKNGHPLKTVEQANNGLLIVAEIKSSIWTWGGEILITIEDRVDKSMIIIDAKIKGQLYDWGKSKSIVEKITQDLFFINL